ncbi:hypothetical protein CJ209_03975 [Fusobacterium nucleatum]|uniref:PIN family toxin-antitoxin system n=1 Tax=Fusobacterium nucleatum TaxID=851 RepID=A0A2N6TM57_FUSNU|nr:hypothetical protein CBG60_10175 [Fusobacterium animalis]PMC70407.1 hypothetical protein CJ209_03975 [Fusobacterium nucleatum]
MKIKYKRGCCKLINEVKNSSLLAKFLNDEKLTFAANSLNSFHSNTARFARLTCFNFSSKI